MKYQNLCLLPDLNLTNFNFEPLFHCFLLALIGGICLPAMTATYLFKSAKIHLRSLNTLIPDFQYSVFLSLPSPLFSPCPFQNIQNSLNVTVGFLLILHLEEEAVVCHFYFAVLLNITGLC